MKIKDIKAALTGNELSNSWYYNQKLILLMLTIGGSAIILLWQLFDKYYFNLVDERLTWLRYSTIVVYVLNLILAFNRKKNKAIKLHIISGFYFGSLFCTLLAVYTGASHSPYWFGMFFIIVGWYVLIPYNFKEMAIHSVAFIIIFISGQYIQTEFAIINHEMVKIIFLYSGTLLVSFFAAFIRNKLDNENYQIKTRLKENNDELLAMNEELHTEIENHHHTSQQLIEKQQFIDNIITNAPLVIWSMDLDGIFTYSHGKGLENIGVDPNQNVGKSVIEVYKGTEVENFIKKVISDEIQNDIIRINDIYYDTRVSPLFDSFGQKIGYMGVSMDITERIKIEKDLKKFRLVIDQAPGAVFIVNKNSNFEYFNPEFTRISGYTEDDLLNKSLIETLYKGELPESRRNIIETISLGNRWQGEILTTNKDGSTYWANTIAAPYKSSSGEIDGFIVIQQDITHRKEMELAIKEKESLYRTLIEKSQDGVAISQDRKILLANQAFCDILGYEMDELLNIDPESILAPEDKQMVLERHYKRLSGEADSHRYTAKFIHKSGKIVVLDLNAATVQMNGKNASFVTMRDITERSRMEEALKTSEDKYRKLFEAEMDAIFLIDVSNGQIIEANPAASTIYGYTHEELIKLKNTDLSAEPDKTYSAVKQKQSLVPIRHHCKKDGTIFTVELSAGFTVFEGRDVQIVTARDITERIEMQKALHESEEKYRKLVENSQDGIIIVRYNKILFANDTYCKMIGYSLQELDQFTASDFIYKEDRIRAIKLSERRIQGDVSTITEPFRLIDRNGNIIECETYSTMIDYEGVPASFFTIHNITESKKMEKALRESEEKYRMLVENSQDAICIAQDDYFKFVNSAMCKMLGYTAEEIYSMPGINIIPPEEHNRILRINKERLEGKISALNYPLQLIAKDNSIVEVEAQSSTFDYEGKPAGFFTLHNITHRKKIQAALRESEEKYRNLIEQADDGIIITQVGFFKFVNRAFCRMMQYSENELIGKPYLDFVIPDDHEMMEEYHRRRMAGEEFNVIYRSKIIRKDGKILHVELNTRTSVYEGNPSAFIVTRDITDRLKTEEELRKAKEELETLNNDLEQRVIESSVKLTEANTQLISLQKENLQSQFEVLRQQVNPHFLFNSLNVLTSLIKLEPDLAEKFTEHLSKVYRYVLENKDNDLVSLKTELEFLDAYIFLLNIRFMDKIEVKVEIDDIKKELLILPLALQLLIENAIKHNTMSRKNPLKIHIFIDNEMTLNIVNNLQERESNMVSTGVGLKNIEHRYKLLEMAMPEFYKTDSEFVAKIPLKK
jgi:PAS domain S-box-containing protein